MVVFYHMNDIEVKDYSNFHLSIEINEIEICFLLIDKSNQKTVAFETLVLGENSLKTTIELSEIYKKTTPNSVSCAVQNSFFTLIPKAIFDESNKDSYLQFSQQPKSEMQYYFDKLVKHDAVNCFGVSEEIHHELSSIFSNIKFTHITSVLCDTLPEGIHINFSSPKEFEIIVLENKKLLFLNRFITENEEEGLYFLNLVIEKLGQDLQNTSVTLSGSVDKKSPYFQFWKQFIPDKNIRFNEIAATQLNAVDRHKKFSLHKQFQCV